jgi:hypothetical protein
VNVNYGVIPDQGGSCAGGCGANAQRVNHVFSVSSHELIEATTDPAVGLATVFGPTTSWRWRGDSSRSLYRRRKKYEG